LEQGERLQAPLECVKNSQQWWLPKVKRRCKAESVRKRLHVDKPRVSGETPLQD
jgi:hypothetical protein